MTEHTTAFTDAVAAWLWRTSWQGGLLVLAVLALRLALGLRLGPRWRCWLWGLVAARLLAPALPAVAWHPLAWVDRAVHGTPAEARTARPVTVTVGYESPAGTIAATTTTATSLSPLAGDALAVTSNDVRQGSGDRAPALLVVGWLAVAAALLGWRTGRAAYWSRRIRRSCHPVTDPAALALLAECRAALRVRGPVALVTSTAVAGPAVCGVRRPWVVFPPDRLAALDPRELRFVLLHELAHVKRRDVAAGWAVAVLTAAHWFNPLVWLAARCYQADRELACDEIVLRQLDAGREPGLVASYGQTLLKLAVPAGRSPAGIGMGEAGTQLRRRIAMIASFTNGAGSRRATAVVVPTLALLFVAWVALTDVRAQAQTPGVGGQTVAKPTTRPAGDGATAPQVLGDDDDPAGDRVIVRTYDVRDLVQPIPNHEPPGGIERAANATPSPTRDEMVREIIKLIVMTVDPDSWRENGGLTGNVQENFGLLVILQSETAHGKVAALLDQLRRARGVVVSVQTRFLVVEPSRLAEVLGGPAVEREAVVDRGVLDHVRAAADRPVDPLLQVSAPRVTMFSGQRAWVRVTTADRYVADYTVTRIAAGDVRYEPRYESVESGIVLDLQATAAADRGSVTITLCPSRTELLAMDQEPFVGAGDVKGLMVQRPKVVRQELGATSTVPSGRALLYRWFAETDVAGKPTGRSVYLLLEADVFDGGTEPRAGR